jgi:hypothetical protein
MDAVVDRHLARLDPERTVVLCMDMLGGDLLVLHEAVGLWRLRDYPDWLKDRLTAHAERLGLRLRRGLRFPVDADSLPALRAGLPTALISSTSETGLPGHYHWPTDVPAHVNHDTIRAAAQLCHAFIADGRPA